MSEKLIFFLHIKKALPRDGSFLTVLFSSHLRRRITVRQGAWEEMAKDWVLDPGLTTRNIRGECFPGLLAWRQGPSQLSSSVDRHGFPRKIRKSRES